MPRINWSEVLDEIDKARLFFESQDVKPTLRTIFYYLVGKALIPNTRSSYKTLSRQLVEARKSGRFSWEFLEDRTRVTLGELKDESPEDLMDLLNDRLRRQLDTLDFDRVLDEIFDYLKPRINLGRWAEQEVVPEIWLEKDALATTIHSWTREFDVPVRVNRGYSSWTFIYNNVLELVSLLRKEGHDKVKIIYLGDLDPSGLDIDRFLQEALLFFGLGSSRVEFERIALLPEHVENYNLPPRPEDAETIAKLHRDSRYSSYTEEYIAELDSMVGYVPQELRRIVREAVEELWSESIYNDLEERKEDIESDMNEVLENIKQGEGRDKVLDIVREVLENEDEEDKEEEE